MRQRASGGGLGSEGVGRGSLAVVSSGREESPKGDSQGHRNHHEHGYGGPDCQRVGHIE